MPDDLSLLDQLEEWLEAQVPSNFHQLSLKMFETMERVSNEIFESLNMHGPPSISIPFPPFSSKDVPPPPPPPPPRMSFPSSIVCKSNKLFRAHPYAATAGTALVLGVGLGLTGKVLGFGPFASGEGGRRLGRRGRLGTRGVVEDGMLKEAVVLLSPSPMPPILWTLTVTLLKAGYITIVVVPRSEDADALEARLAPLEEKSALRVLIYDPDDHTTFPPFERSLFATLTLRFPAPNALPKSDPYNPQPTHIPHIHAFISLYPLNPSPSNQPSALPALPSLLEPMGSNGSKPMLITLYSSSSTLVQPDSFASQVLTTTHDLLARNLAARSTSRVVSVYLGNLQLPPLHQLMAGAKLMIYKLTWKEKWQQASSIGKLVVAKDYVLAGLGHAYGTVMARLGYGSNARNYAAFEHQISRIIKSRHGQRWHIGQYAYLPLFLSRLPTFSLPYLLAMLPALPGPTGPLHNSTQGLPAPRKPLGGTAGVGKDLPSVPQSGQGKSKLSRSASSSDHESGEDLASSIHTVSSGREGGSDSGSGTGLEGSWVGLEAAN